MPYTGDAKNESPAWYCRRCDYPLTGLGLPRCPECGLAFDPADAATVSPRPDRRRRRAVRRGLAVLLVVGPVAGYLLLAATVPCGFAGWKVCSRCGAIEETDERHPPLVGVTVHTRRLVRPTAVSAALARNGVRVGHSHEWAFGQGGDYGLSRSCALGEGRHLYGVVTRPDVGAFVDRLCRYADPAERDLWLGRLLNPTVEARAVGDAVAEASPPPGGFPDAATFGRWWGQNRTRFEEIVRLQAAE